MNIEKIVQCIWENAGASNRLGRLAIVIRKVGLSTVTWTSS